MQPLSVAPSIHTFNKLHAVCIKDVSRQQLSDIMKTTDPIHCLHPVLHCSGEDAELHLEGGTTEAEGGHPI